MKKSKIIEVMSFRANSEKLELVIELENRGKRNSLPNYLMLNFF